MTAIIGATVVGVAVFVVASAGFAIAKHRANMPESTRWLAVLGLFAMGIPLALLTRYVQSGLSEAGQVLSLVAILIGFAAPLRSFRKRARH